MTTPGELYDRRVSLTLGTLDVSALDISFEVKKNLKPEPNTAKIQIWNLSASQRRQLETAKSIPVRLEAGYAETGLTQVYFGEVRSAWSYNDGPGDIVTEIGTGDGEQAARERIHIPLGPKSPPDQALAAIAKALGVGPGNLAKATTVLRSRTKAIFPVASALSGNAYRNMTDFCRSADLEWSIQDGNLQILDRDKATEQTALLVSAATGLVGSPSAGYDSKTGKHLVNLVTFLLPDMKPGRLIVLDSIAVKGGYRVLEVEYLGDTAGTQWYCKITAEKY